MNQTKSINFLLLSPIIFSLLFSACGSDSISSEESKNILNKLEFLEKKTTQLSERIYKLETTPVNPSTNISSEVILDKPDQEDNEQNIKKDTSNSSVIKDITYVLDENSKDDPFIGTKDSKILIVGFLDLLCKDCKTFVSSIAELKKLIDKDKLIQFRLKDFPLNRTPLSLTTAVFSNCAGEQGLYWEYIAEVAKLNKDTESELKSIFSKQVFEKKNLKSKLNSCLTSKRYSLEVLKDKELGESLGVDSVPSFFIGSKISEDNYFGVLLKNTKDKKTFSPETLMNAANILNKAVSK